MPKRLGGLGGQLACSRRNAAFLASWSGAAEEVVRDLGCSSLHDALERLPAAARKLEEARQGLAGQGLLLADGGTLADSLARELKQGLAMEKVQKTHHAALLQRLPLLQQATLRGQAGPGAAAFLGYPTEALCALEDARWETAARLRLYLWRPECDRGQLAAAAAHCCLRNASGEVCARPLDDLGYHGATCQNGGGVVRRHARLARRLGGLLRRWRHEQPLFEQRVPEWDRQLPGREAERAVLDLEYQYEDGRRWLDVTVRHPTAGTQAEVRVAARRDGEASRRG